MAFDQPDDLSALADYTFLGFERWAPYAPRLAALGDAERRDLLASLTRAWDAPAPLVTDDDVRRMFLLKVAQGDARGLRDQGAGPSVPIAEAAVTSWERAHETRLPRYLRWVLTHITAGHRQSAEDEDGNVVVHHWQQLRSLTSWDAADDGQGLPVDLVAAGLDALAASPDGHAVLDGTDRDEEGHMERGDHATDESRDAAGSALLLSLHFEPNHADSCLVLVLRGALSARFVRLDGALHGGPSCRVTLLPDEPARELFEPLGLTEGDWDSW